MKKVQKKLKKIYVFEVLRLLEVRFHLFFNSGRFGLSVLELPSFSFFQTGLCCCATEVLIFNFQMLLSHWSIKVHLIP